MYKLYINYKIQIMRTNKLHNNFHVILNYDKITKKNKNYNKNNLFILINYF